MSSNNIPINHFDLSTGEIRTGGTLETMNINITDPEEERRKIADVAKMIANIMHSEGEENYENWQAQERKFAEFLREGQPFGLDTPKMDQWIDLLDCKKPYMLGLLMKTWSGVWDLKELCQTQDKEIKSLKEEVFTYMKDPDSPIQKEYIRNVGADILQEYGQLKGIEKILIAEVKKREQLETEVAHHKGIIKQYEQLMKTHHKVTVAARNPETGEIESFETTLRHQIQINCELKHEIDELRKGTDALEKGLVEAKRKMQKQTKAMESQLPTMRKMKKTIEEQEDKLHLRSQAEDKWIEAYHKRGKKLDAATKENKRLKAALKKHQEEKKALSTDQINKSEIVKILKKSITELTSSLATRTKQYEDYKRKMKKSRRK